MENLNHFNRKYLFQLREIGLSITFISGSIDAYTFLQHGGVLAAGQTGNLIFLGIDIANGNYGKALIVFVTIAAFALGVFCGVLLKQKIKSRFSYWRLISLIIVYLVCLFIGLIQNDDDNLVIAPLLSFAMAMQNISFSSIVGLSYNNVFSTGNLKNAIELSTKYIFTKNKQDLISAKVYIQLILAFTGGAFSSTFLQGLWAESTIWVVSFLVLFVIFYYGFLLRQRAI